MRLPFGQAPSKISFQPGSTLVALLGVLGEELHDNGRQRLGDCSALIWRCRPASNVALDPLQWGGGGKPQPACKDLVQSGAQRVEIAAPISSAVHAAGLVVRQRGQRAGNYFERYLRT